MAFKLERQAEKHWRRLNAHQQIKNLINGVIFKNGVMEKVA